MPSVSIVIPLYNASKYISRFMLSLQGQTLTDFEAIFIDDCSSDESVTMVKGLSSNDSRIKLIQNTRNLGAGAARNIGIRSATGETLCFADPDDLLPQNSLGARYNAYKKYNSIIRACYDEISENNTLLMHETPPKGNLFTCNPSQGAERFGVSPFLSGHWTWLFPTKFIQRNNIYNEENVRTAEDILFLTRCFYNIPKLTWINDVVYLWIKRQESLSNRVYTNAHYKDYLKCVHNFYIESKNNKMLKLGDKYFDEYLECYLPHLMNQCIENHSTEDDVREVIKAATDICSQFDVLSRFSNTQNKRISSYSGIYRLIFTLTDKSPLLLQRLVKSQNIVSQHYLESFYRQIATQGWQRQASVDKYDHEQDLLRLRYLFCEKHPEEFYTYNGTRIAPAYAKTRLAYRSDELAIFERILWLPVPPKTDGILEFALAGENAGLKHAPGDIRRAFSPDRINDLSFPSDIRAVRHMAFSKAMEEKFKDAWMFIDKDSEADDNAEHLYRWTTKHHPEINAFFVISNNSRDWNRLQNEGFNLVNFGSIEHKILYLLGKYIISSQMDRYIFTIEDDKYFSDFKKPKFICLPHGVTKDDVSEWFNSIPFDLFVAATHDEVNSIVSDTSPYVMTRKEVVLSGFPRYDKLMEPCQQENIIFIMPTWRANLVGHWDGKGQKREINPEFSSSDYVARWTEAFSDPRCKELCERFGFRVIFFAHPCFEDYLEAMPFPGFVEKRSKAHGPMIEVLRKSKIFITDFSSVAFDMAYIEKPILYYQYESKNDFVNSQRWKSGYINYQTMGFGPVCKDLDSLFYEIEKILQKGCTTDPTYIERINRTFAYRDANCCSRAFEHIVANSKKNSFSFGA